MVPDIFPGGLAVALALLVALLVLVARHARRERTTRQELADAQSKGFAELLDELTSLRSGLVATGVVERSPRLPPAPSLPLPSVAREVVSVTRDDDPIHTRATVEAPPPDEPPSTKPSQSRKVPAPPTPRSAPRPVAFEDQIARAMKRLERQVKVPPEVEARWAQRLRALGSELGLREDAEPTEAQVEAMIRELYHAEADVKDAHPAAAAPLEATLASAASPIAVRIAAVAAKPADAEGEATLRREGDRPAGLGLPCAHADDEDDRDTGEDMTKVYTPGPRAMRDLLAGVESERPTSSAARTAAEFRRQRLTLLGGLVHHGARRNDGQDEGDGR
jgi:hypothetical protein